MKLEKQVCAREYAEQICKLGIAQESTWYWVNSSLSTGFEGGDRIWLCDKKWKLYNFIPDVQLDDTGKITEEEGLIPDYLYPDGYTQKKADEYRNKIRPEKIRNLKVYSAFTVAELGEMLPRDFDNMFLSITKYWNPEEKKEQWIVQYAGNKEYKFKTKANTEANARAKMRIYLIEKGLVKMVKFKCSSDFHIMTVDKRPLENLEYIGITLSNLFIGFEQN